MRVILLSGFPAPSVNVSLLASQEETPNGAYTTRFLAVRFSASAQTSQRFCFPSFRPKICLVRQIYKTLDFNCSYPRAVRNCRPVVTSFCRLRYYVVSIALQIAVQTHIPSVIRHEFP